MILAELLGEDAFRERVKIYATDIDEEALEAARHAIYTPKEIEHVPEDLRARYFERFDQRVAFRKDLRRSVIFGRNNLIADAPISRLDLLICRNTLMYLNAETQARIIRHFHFALGVRRGPHARQVGDDDLPPRALRAESTSSRGSSGSCPARACRRGSPAWATARWWPISRSPTTTRACATRRSTSAPTRR